MAQRIALAAYYLCRVVPLRVFEILCVPVLVLAIALGARRAGARRFVIDYAILAIAGWIGEATSIAWYRYYEYASGWDLRLFTVPLLVPLIWPLVILSARDVRDALFPRAGRFVGAAIVTALVIADASMVEVLAVRAGLWTWAEDGHLGVPVLGIVAWGFFAGAADLALRRFQGRDRWLVIPAALALAHALIVLSWWACFRWVLRHDLGWASVAFVALTSLAATFVALRLRRAGRTIPIAVAAPRIVAASLFVALLFSVRPDAALIAHVALVAIPYSTASARPSSFRLRKSVRA
jgi:hypothetical protein